ncbi:MAG: helix-turn-helix transcriptional regulator [Alphaproteobacteria bacterium]|nr:helix-turn-helix transcriptional regulator [Alphaproteobacteria bacterium]MBU1552274.1 helix-turn-helix transcriptional regulator [Alphaproteobacteria bacterium]MBU2336818.1 helix-turn-helix transcriptional regulator [Alphaproteobacteria bacterium]MBU2389574.1 helix-turn-helix transcriptional regulator [Alphaproteobacteria bacterium]
MGQADKGSILTPALCRAARGLLDWTQQQLSDASAVSRSTIRDFEGARHGLHKSTAVQLRRTFESAGVMFTQTAGCGPGLCSGPSEPWAETHETAPQKNLDP